MIGAICLRVGLSGQVAPRRPLAGPDVPSSWPTGDSAVGWSVCAWDLRSTPLRVRASVSWLGSPARGGDDDGGRAQGRDGRQRRDDEDADGEQRVEDADPIAQEAEEGWSGEERGVGQRGVRV